MTSPTPQDHFNGLAKRFQSYNNARRRRNIVIGLGSAAALGGGALVSLLPGITSGTRNTLIIIPIALVYALVLVGIQIEIRARKFLPSVEDRLFYLFHSANSDLRSFARTGATIDRENAVASLTDAAGWIDTWNWGNLKFLGSTIGVAVVGFKTNFRGRLLPAVSRTKKDDAISILPTLMEMEDVFDLDRLNQVSIENWNNWLTQKSPEDPSRDRYPYEPPPARETGLSKLKSRKYQFFFLLSALFGPPITYFLIVDFSLASHDAAVYGSVGVLGIVVAAYFAYLPLTRQKGS